jgi:hypothetical protein
MFRGVPPRQKGQGIDDAALGSVIDGADMPTRHPGSTAAAMVSVQAITIRSDLILFSKLMPMTHFQIIT